MIAEELTSFYDDVGMRCERDAFDTLFDHAPDKLQVNNSIIYQSYISRSIAGGEEEPGDFCEQAPQQDQPGGDRVGVPVLRRGESHSHISLCLIRSWRRKYSRMKLRTYFQPLNAVMTYWNHYISLLSLKAWDCIINIVTLTN